ncbi:PREDICTED: L-amino-acid oxidase-like [Thamnophis sirtalis]|uniref:L-amino-acid oxidase n=1 Tax=Thamnophis sirtalis TaxID=35019 RepID=A0A6I9XY94_9SAUR|nr:PREDICTED: L-amino-acid oxidase-like [Thamnophis sirtalis]
MGCQEMVVLTGYETVKEALVNQAKAFAERAVVPIFEDYAKGFGVIFAHGENWRQMRQFSIAALRDYGMGKRIVEDKISEECSVLIKTYATYEAILSLVPLLLAIWASVNHANEEEDDWMKCFEDPNYEELLNIARNGLEKTSNPKRIVIVGAGISGLTAAKLLKDAGHQVSIIQILHQMQNLNKLRDLFVDGIFVSMFLGFLNLFSFEEITGGFDQLPNSFCQEMSKIIYLNSRVEKIIRSSKYVKVFFHKDDEDDSSFLIADYVLVTATAKATRLIKFQPPLSLSKAYALRSLHYTSATKIALVCKDKFWEREGIRGGASLTDLPTRLVTYPSHDFPGGLGVLLVSYTLHDDADFFAPLSDDECLDVVMDDLSKIHNISKYYLESVCNRHVIQKWALDKFSMGAFTFPTPYQYNFFLKALFQNEGRVYFAGEHTTYPFGWIDSSMKSAIRAACSIHLNAHKSISQDLKDSVW